MRYTLRPRTPIGTASQPSVSTTDGCLKRPNLRTCRPSLRATALRSLRRRPQPGRWGNAFPLSPKELPAVRLSGIVSIVHDDCVLFALPTGVARVDLG